MKKGCLCQDPFFFLILKFTYLLIPFLFLALKEQYTYISGMAQTLLECGKKTNQKKTLSIVHDSWMFSQWVIILWTHLGSIMFC